MANAGLSGWHDVTKPQALAIEPSVSPTGRRHDSVNRHIFARLLLRDQTECAAISLSLSGTGSIMSHDSLCPGKRRRVLASSDTVLHHES